MLLVVATAPSTRTLPSATSPAATERVTPVSMATARSIRTPCRRAGTSNSAVTATAPPPGCAELQDEQEHHAHRDGTVGHVEGRPVGEGDEVHHVTVVAPHQAVGQVPTAPPRTSPRPTATATRRVRRARKPSTATSTTATTAKAAALPVNRLKAEPEL